MTNQGNTEKNMSENEIDQNLDINEDENEESEEVEDKEVKPVVKSNRGRPRKDPNEPKKTRPIMWVGIHASSPPVIETIISPPGNQLETEESAKEMFLSLTGKECHEIRGPFLECRTLSKALGGDTASSKAKGSKGIDLAKFVQENKLTGEGCKAEIGVWSNVSVFYTTSDIICLASYEDATCNPGEGKKKKTPPAGLQPTLIVHLKNPTPKVLLKDVKAA